LRSVPKMRNGRIPGLKFTIRRWLRVPATRPHWRKRRLIHGRWNPINFS
jgi:hypothetical protein